ncbi:MAG: S41 family peptidase [Acidobacteriota bacterium]
MWKRRAPDLARRTIRTALLSLLLVQAATGPAAAGQEPTQPPAKAVETFDAAWRIVQETHFDPHFNGVDWLAVGAELRPKAEAARNIDELRVVLCEMLGRLRQSHFRLWSREMIEPLEFGRLRAAPGQAGRRGEFRAADRSGEVGFEVALLDGRFFVSRIEPGGGADSAGVQPGWQVQSQGATELSVQLERLPEGINRRVAEFQAERAVVSRLAGPPGSSVVVPFLDVADEPVELELERRIKIGEVVKFGNLPPLVARLERNSLVTASGVEVGVIRFNIWLPPLASEFDEAIDELRGTDGIIVDLRGNPGGVGGMVMGIAGHFLDDPISLGSMRMRDTALHYVVNPRQVNPAGERVEPFAGPLAVLVSASTASTSEVFAGGLQAIGRARVFGQRSMGAVLPSLLDRLPNGDVLQHAIADFTTASGERLEGRGVVPDMTVALCREDLLSGRDATLDAAVRWIERQSREIGGTPKGSRGETR